MSRALDFFVGLPAALLAHPWLTLAGAALLGAGHLGLMVTIWRFEDRRDRERARARYR